MNFWGRGEVCVPSWLVYTLDESRLLLCNEITIKSYLICCDSPSWRIKNQLHTIRKQIHCFLGYISWRVFTSERLLKAPKCKRLIWMMSLWTNSVQTRVRIGPWHPLFSVNEVTNGEKTAALYLMSPSIWPQLPKQHYIYKLNTDSGDQCPP